MILVLLHVLLDFSHPQPRSLFTQTKQSQNSAYAHPSVQDCTTLDWAYVQSETLLILTYTTRSKPKISCLPPYRCTNKKENQIFLIYLEMQKGAVAKSYMTIPATSYMGKYLRISSYIRKPFLTWLCNCSTLNFLIYEENSIFFFISVLCKI